MDQPGGGGHPAQLHEAGIDVVTVPVDGTAGMDGGGGGQLLRDGPGHPDVQPVPDGDRRAGTRRTGGPGPTTPGLEPLRRPPGGPAVRPGRTGAQPGVRGAIYAQIDDQLWDQMVALPLFQEPALVANGVQMAMSSTTPRSTGSCGTSPSGPSKPGPPTTSGEAVTGDRAGGRTVVPGRPLVGPAEGPARAKPPVVS